MEDAKRPNKRLQYERELRGWSQAYIAEKIGTVEKTVSRWECGEQNPGPTYRRRLCKLFGKNAVELGFLQEGHEEGKEEQQELPANSSANPLINLSALPPQNNFTPILVLGNIPDVALSQFTAPQSSTLLLLPQTAEIGLDAMDRRGFLSESLKAAGATLVASKSPLEGELLERFMRALQKPSSTDQATLQWLSRRSDGYWQDRNDAIITSRDLVSYVLDDFSKVTTLLEGSLSPFMRASLCSTAGELAMLVGELYFDLKSYARSRQFYGAAITAAREANNPQLQAVAWGRMSFSCSYDDNLQEALICVSNGRHAAKSANATIQAWLAAVETEVQAKLNDKDSLFKALSGIRYPEGSTPQKRETYWVHFNQSLAAGYRGVSFLKLAQKSESAQKRGLSANAQEALAEAIEVLDPGLTRRKPNLLADLAGTYIQTGDIERACSIATEAATLVDQIKSQVVLQRILNLRKELEPWRSTASVSELDNHISSILMSDWYIRGSA